MVAKRKLSEVFSPYGEDAVLTEKVFLSWVEGVQLID